MPVSLFDVGVNPYITYIKYSYTNISTMSYSFYTLCVILFSDLTYSVFKVTQNGLSVLLENYFNTFCVKSN